MLTIATRVSIENFGSGIYPDLFPSHFSNGKAQMLYRGHSSFELVEEIRSLVSLSNAIVLDKYSYNAFHQTALAPILSSRGIRNIIVSGVTTNVCVEGTIRGGFENGFSCELISDASQTFSHELQDHSVQLVKWVFGRVQTSEEIFKRLR